MPMKKVAILRAACCLAGLDGEICDREDPLLKRIAGEAGVGDASLNAMIERAESDTSFFEEQFEVIRSEPESTMKLLFGIAIADGALTQSERVVLHHFSQRLGLDEERYEELLSAAQRRARFE